MNAIAGKINFPYQVPDDQRERVCMPVRIRHQERVRIPIFVVWDVVDMVAGQIGDSREKH